MVKTRGGHRPVTRSRSSEVYGEPAEPDAQQMDRSATCPDTRPAEEGSMPAPMDRQLDRCLGFVRARQTQSGLSRREVQQALLSKVPGSWREQEMPCATWRKYDKAFACDWLSDRLVMLGTKCNHLLLLDVVTAQVREVALPQVNVQRQVAPELQAAPYGQPPSPRSPAQSCGIHAVSLSPDGRMLATGGSHVHDCQVFQVNSSHSIDGSVNLAPATTLVEHADWVFGIAWVTTCHLVTGSRDKTVKLWQVNEEQQVNTQPLKSCFEKAGKVRDVKYMRDMGRLATLAVDGTCHIWDPHLTSVLKIPIQHSQEVVCLGESGSLLAAGSHSHVTLLDPRTKTPVQQISSQEPHHGVRSLAFRDHLLSSGSGHGRLSFYDLRADAWLDMDSTGPEPQPTRTNFQIGAGWLKEDHIYRQYFQDAGPLPNACYAHAWDPTSTRMFCAGGPLAFGLKGVYMGLWA